MKAKQRILISSASVVFGLSLVVGSVFASNTVWAVTDQTTPLAAALTADSLVKVRFFNYDGSIIRSEDVYSGNTVSSVPSPTLNGYTFDYWSTNNSTYEKTNENIATKQFTVNTDYYARFASYGYKIGDGSAAHLANKWDINNNTTIAHGASLTLGTYIYGKTSLENATSAVTIPNAGGYALVCGAHESSWDSSKAGDLNNWSIQRYLTVTKTTDWNDLKLFARVNKSEGYEDKFLSEVSGNDYFVYADYDAVSINFGAVANNVDTVPDNLGATTKYLDAITLDDTTSYTLPGTVYYLTGHFGDVDWNTDSNYILTQDSTDTNLYVKSGVTLAENDLFKIKTNANVWYANESGWDGKNYSLDSGNMKVTKAGVYNIKYHSDWNYNKIDFEAASLYSTFTVTYDSLASGYDIYLCGIDEDWSIVSANKLTPTGAANTYSITKLASDETVNYKYVISDGDSNHDWDTLNPEGNWPYTLGSDYTYTYEAPSSEPTYYIKGDAVSGGWSSSAYPLLVSSKSGIKLEASNVSMSVGEFKVATADWGKEYNGSSLTSAARLLNFTGSNNIYCNFPASYNIQITENNELNIEFANTTTITFSANQSWAFGDKSVPIFIHYWSNDGAGGYISAPYSGSNVVASLPTEATGCQLLRCPNGTTSPSYDIAYNQSGNITLNGSSSYTSTW